MSRAALPGWALLLGLTGTALGSEPGSIRLLSAGGARDVVLGLGFELELVRTWEEEMSPSELEADFLRPLHTVLLSATRGRTERGWFDNRTYHCRAFSLGEITVPAPAMVLSARDGGPAVTVSGSPLIVRVQSALAPGQADEPAESPGPLLSVPVRSRSPWWGMSPLLLVVLVLVGLIHRVRAGGGRPMPTDPLGRARWRLDRLEQQVLREPCEIQPVYVEATGLIREFIVDRFGFPATDRTTEELLSVPATAEFLDESSRELLVEFLSHADRVKFGRHRPGTPERTGLLRAARQILENTAVAARASADRPEPAGGDG